MGERDGARASDAAGLVGDAVMSALEQLVVRLRESAPAATAPAAPAAVEAARPADPAVEGGGTSPAVPMPSGAVAVLGAVVAAIVPAVLNRIDVDELLERVDVQRVVDRVDVDGLVARIDLDALAGRLDVDALLARVDVDALVHRLDIGAITREAMEAVDFGEIVRESSASIGTDVVDGVRFQMIRADDLLARWVDLVLRRSAPRETALDPRRAQP